MLKQTVVLSLLAGLLLLPCTGEAALKPARKTTAAALSPADCCNPRPASDDIELPMPCGMTMVLLFGSIDLSMGAVCSVSNVTYVHLLLYFQDSGMGVAMINLLAMVISLPVDQTARLD